MMIVVVVMSDIVVSVGAVDAGLIHHVVIKVIYLVHQVGLAVQDGLLGLI